MRKKIFFPQFGSARTNYLTAMALFALMAGCGASPVYQKIKVSQAQVNSITRNKPPRLHSGYKTLLEEGERNAVLNHMEIAVDAMQLGHSKLAAQSLDQSISRIEKIFGNNDSAKNARKLWYEEQVKDFKGEPYERSMAFYYRGLLYLAAGEADNARASFVSGVLQDSFAEESQHRSDFALLSFLSGWSARWANFNSLMKSAYGRLKKLRPDFKIPGRDRNVLLIVEMGKSPRKVSDGIGHSELKFRRGKFFKEKKVAVSIDGGERFFVYPMEDIFRQAATRGGARLIKSSNTKPSSNRPPLS
jgi:hypothetical protein